jgi:hypothetical protein
VHVDHAVGVRGVPQRQVGQQPVGRRVGGHVGDANVAGMTQSPIQRWEYLTAPVLVHSTKAILDNFGADGWELVQVVPGMNPENLVAYFKRPVEG